MASPTHPIYGDLVYQRPYDLTRNWFLVDGDAPLATVEWYVDEGSTPEEVVNKMAVWRGTPPSVEAVELIAKARRTFWERQRPKKQ